MASKEDVIAKCEEFYGEIPEGFEGLLNQYPGVIESYLETRSQAFQDPPEGALSWREKYLVLLAIEISNRKVPATHTRNFVKRHGGSPKDVAEVATICLCLGGMITNIEAGNETIKIAEETFEDQETA